MREEETISTTEVRQGSKRKDNMRVLVTSGILIAIVSVLLFVGYNSLWR